VAAGLAVALLLSSPWTPLDAPAELVAPADPAADFTSAQIARADEYRAAVRPPAYVSLALGLAVTIVGGFSPWGAALVRRLPSPRWAPVLVPGAVGGFAVLLAVRLVTLPLSAWQESVRQQYGLSTRDWGDWALDVARGFGVQAGLTLLGVLAIVLLAARWPAHWRGEWWMVAAPGAAGLVVVASLAYPLVVEPAFNRFEPLPESRLRTSLLALAEQEGVAVGDVLVADASRRTTTLNAYVSGFGPTKRLVLYDTLLEQAPDDEVEMVVAHELAHAREGDVLTGTLLGAGGAALVVLLTALAGSWRPLVSKPGLVPGRRSRGRWVPSGAALGQAPAVPFVLATVTVLGFLGGPGEMAVSRHIEARADVVALELTGDADTFVRMQHSLAVAALSDLDPPRALHWWFASHPTAPERIAMARTWAAVTAVPVPPPMTTPPD
jgi:STE24 endopeptidase